MIAIVIMVMLIVIAMVTVILIAVMVMRILPMVEIEHVEEVADRRHIHRYPRILPIHDRIRQVVAAAIRDLAEMPVPLDELQDRHLIVVRVDLE